jgi:hypothetical protein
MTLVEKCFGCENTVHGLCACYVNTEAQWKRGNCPRATHVGRKRVEEKNVNPLKASKRAAKKGKK